MAFQQPQRHPAPRHASLHSPPSALPPVLNTQSAIARDSQYTPQSEEWVLFSPGSHDHTGTDSTQTPRTAARSRISGTGSLDTAAVSERPHDEQDQESQDDPRESDADHETEDLDSLDDGLHAFHPHRVVESSQTVLPTHDGLGMFPGNSSLVQDQIWQHERYNPRRRRSSALKHDTLQARDEELHQIPSSDDDRFQRIEKWRVEQSRAILDEIERETRRMRRRRRMAESKVAQSHSHRPTVASSSQPPPRPSEMPESPAARPESLWERFKRHVIRDLMGLDDATLSYIFGETLPTEAEEADATPQKMVEHAERTVQERHALVRNTDSWEEKLLARIAHELGSLIHQISEHPGAFSSYLRTQDPMPYAGFATPKASKLNLKAERDAADALRFRPTLPAHTTQDRSDPSLWGVEDEPPPAAAAAATAAAESRRERAYWERDLDINMVFGFLRSRLTSATPAPPPTDDDPDPLACLVSTPAPAPPADSLRRAALIRHHHPLVSARPAAPRRPSSLSAPLSPVLGRRDSSSVVDGADSCASQSTKKSKTTHSASLGGDSRNYWDLGAGGSSAWGEAS